MRLDRGLHTAYAFVVFATLFFLFFVPLLVPVVWRRKWQWVGVINRWWARAFFRLSFIPYRVHVRGALDRKQQYIFCPNHFSYLDIPALGLNPCNAIFVGKNDMEKIPLFGFMYKKLHITVNRRRLMSRFETYVRSVEALEAGKSLIIFPEGGVITRQPPLMARFKDGAFRAAIEKQIPIVPVTIPHNWIILPDRKILLLGRGTMEVIFHEPIPVAGLTMDDLPALKAHVFRVIQTELFRRHPQHADRHGNIAQAGAPGAP
jgi:1-acyl-sn-glycerol-3-phosphate acyltransferase